MYQACSYPRPALILPSFEVLELSVQRLKRQHAVLCLLLLIQNQKVRQASCWIDSDLTVARLEYRP